MRERAFAPGDRVRHRQAYLSGVVEKAAGDYDYVTVKWDHYGLAVAALGTMADLQKPESLLRAEDDRSETRA